jgi:predicted amidohydrolase YtcJ
MLLLLLVACRDGGVPLTVFTAERIVTMEAAQPEATAVAVEGDRIIAVGSPEQVRAALAPREPAFDRRFEGKFLMPGFIDPHIHPTLAATILQLEIVSAMEWETTAGKTRAVRGRGAFLERLAELEAREPDPDGWLIVWGYHQPYHGTLSRADLDALSTERPIVVWQRSVHEFYFNSAALAALALERADFDAHPQADWETGHLWERGAFELGAPMVKRLSQPLGYLKGLAMMSEVLHRGGLTTVGEQGFPQVSETLERLTLRWALRGDVPLRFVLVPNAMHLVPREGDAAAAERAAAAMLGKGSEQIAFVRHVKLYADGAIFSQLMQMSEPYLDGHHGEWMMSPEQQGDVIDTFWDADWSLHVHVNGDAGLDTVLALLEEKRAASPRDDLRIVFEHYGYARPDQHARVAALGASVSNNAYYLHELAPIYAEHGLGPERAADISPLGGLRAAGVPISFHSDFPMAPAEPQTQVWVATNRNASAGAVWGADQRIDRVTALRAITIEAARSLGMEHEIGSIAVGKKADFTVLEADPTAVPLAELRDIPIWGTVFEGRPFPLGD